MPKFRIPGISLTPASPADDNTIHSISRGSSSTILQPPTSGLILHSVGGLPLILQQYSLPPSAPHLLPRKRRKLLAETRMGEMTLALDLETSFAELYRDLQKRAARRAIFQGGGNVVQIKADEVVGFMHLDLKGQDYPIVEENWEREVRGLCSVSGARFRFEFYVVREVGVQVEGKLNVSVKKMVVAAGCGLVCAARRVVGKIVEAVRRE